MARVLGGGGVISKKDLQVARLRASADIERWGFHGRALILRPKSRRLDIFAKSYIIHVLIIKLYLFICHMNHSYVWHDSFIHIYVSHVAKPDGFNRGQNATNLSTRSFHSELVVKSSTSNIWLILEFECFSLHYQFKGNIYYTSQPLHPISWRFWPEVRLFSQQ